MTDRDAILKIEVKRVVFANICFMVSYPCLYLFRYSLENDKEQLRTKVKIFPSSIFN